MYHHDPRIVEAFTEGNRLPFALYLVDKYPHLTVHYINRGAHCYVVNEATGHAYDVRGIIRWSQLYDYFFLDSDTEKQRGRIPKHELEHMRQKRFYPEVTFAEGEDHLLKNLSFYERDRFRGEG